jgi:hypothetical protein
MKMDHLKNELEAIRLKNGGLLTEEAILDVAKAKTHPLHDEFTWDNTQAGKLWRLEEARRLIRSVYVTIESPKHAAVSVRAYASLPSDREASGGYRAIQDVLADKELRRELLAAALSELEAFKRRYSNLAQLAPVFSAIDTIKTKASKARVSKPRNQKARQSAEVGL